MGNCARKEASNRMVWGGEDWGCLGSEESDRSRKIEEKGLLKGTFSSSSSSSKPTTITEVKVKITKKQLEELLGKTDIQGLSVEQVLGQLMKVSEGYESHQRSWRPALQSIPEIN